MSKKKSKCVWKKTRMAGEDTYYEMTCGPDGWRDHWFDMADLESRGFKFCPYCGKEIKVKE